jgi:hypothetical protein
MRDGPADRNGRTPAQVVREYVALRREWDLATGERVSAVKRDEPSDPDPRDFDWDAANAAWSDLHRLRQQWCTPEAVERLHPRASFGNSSEFNPDLEILDERQTSDDEVTLRTREYPFDADGTRLPTEYEYSIRLIDGEGRLDGRSSEGIRDLL